MQVRYRARSRYLKVKLKQMRNCNKLKWREALFNDLELSELVPEFPDIQPVSEKSTPEIAVIGSTQFTRVLCS